MANNIYPNFWFNDNAKAAAELYIKAFGNGKITDDNSLVVGFELFDQKFIGLNGGPQYQMNPSISMFVSFDNEAELMQAWEILNMDAKVLMGLETYSWAKKYGWLQDQYGLSWQLFFNPDTIPSQKIAPMLMYTNFQKGKAKAAMEFYTEVFPDSKINAAINYSKDDGDDPEYLIHAEFTLNNQLFMAMDSSFPHLFSFNEGVSLVISCDGQSEVDYYWNKLRHEGCESMCGWLKDKYGVSWQVVPIQLRQKLGDRDPIKT